MADLAKFHQTKRKFMDLTILANFYLNSSKENQFGGIDNCVEFSSNTSKQSQLGRFDNFDEFFSSFVTAYISGLISLISQFTYFKHCFLPGFFNCIKVTASTFIVCNVSLVTVN